MVRSVSVRSNVSYPDESSGPQVTKLNSELPRDLLRAVPLHRALEGYGRHWKGIAGSADDFHRSIATTGIDDFISHDWRTHGVVKYVTLSYVYNSRAALVGSTLVAAVGVFAKEIATRWGVTVTGPVAGASFPDLFAFSLLCPFLYLLFLFNWQALRARLGGSRRVFLDKLCISQHDEEKKAAGIRGLAGFLKKSNRIIVLWGPVYFSRLWCTFELAAWFRLERSLASVLFVPVQVPPLLVSGLLGVSISCLGRYAEIVTGSATPTSTVTTMVGWILFSYFIQVHVEDVAELRQQLEGFSIQQAACFCCSNRHRHPQTGESLPCDRDMVYHTLRRWTRYSRNADSDSVHIEGFNEEVRTTLLQYVTHALPESQLFIRYSDMVQLGFPFFWLLLDSLSRHSRGKFEATRVLHVTEAFSLVLLTCPIAITIVLRLLYWARPLGQFAKRSKTRKLALSCCFWGPCSSVLSLVFWQLVRRDNYLRLLGDAVWAMFVPVAFFAVLAYYAFAWNLPEEAVVQRTFSLEGPGAVECPATITPSSAKVRAACSDATACEETLERQIQACQQDEASVQDPPSACESLAEL
eukprot:TRINITY_DN19105_c0_g1_i1.p1 TRINITY_DN19105_c0_g1~~TRINITY_DN19105_c0_g1_i1.p1  ORF type:complete len:581 (-),score=38.43 TRINITY_DN19105_c0_g1_i1:73-1815(-)